MCMCACVYIHARTHTQTYRYLFIYMKYKSVTCLVQSDLELKDLNLLSVSSKASSIKFDCYFIKL